MYGMILESEAAREMILYLYLAIPETRISLSPSIIVMEVVSTSFSSSDPKETG